MGVQNQGVSKTRSHMMQTLTSSKSGILERLSLSLRVLKYRLIENRTDCKFYGINHNL